MKVKIEPKQWSRRGRIRSDGSGASDVRTGLYKLEAGYAFYRNEKIMNVIVICGLCQNTLHEIPNISKDDLPLSDQQLDSYADSGFEQSQGCSKHPKAEKLALVVDSSGVRKKKSNASSM